MKVMFQQMHQAVPDVANHKYQAQVTVAENPNVTGYIFIGWTAATENGTAVTTTGGKFVMPDANVVLKGSFTAAEQNYRVKYLDEDTKEEIHTMSDPKGCTLWGCDRGLYREN